jgi:hypothetical protein
VPGRSSRGDGSLLSPAGKPFGLRLSVVEIPRPGSSRGVSSIDLASSDSTGRLLGLCWCCKLGAFEEMLPLSGVSGLWLNSERED